MRRWRLGLCRSDLRRFEVNLKINLEATYRGSVAAAAVFHPRGFKS